MNCNAGVCTAIAKGANLNVDDLTTMLAVGDTTVKTGGGAITIQVLDGFSWTSTSHLTLDANHSIGVHQPVVVAGTGSMTITYNDIGSDGDLIFLKKGRIEFSDTDSSLTINGDAYTLVNDLHSLYTDINNAQGSGHYALANDYDASVDGIYGSSPITDLFGTIEGLGNSLLNVSMQSTNVFGLVWEVFGGTIRDLKLSNIVVNNLSGFEQDIGGFAGIMRPGTIVGCSVSGTVHSPIRSKYPNTGGLVGSLQGGLIDRSSSTANVSSGSWVGGLVGVLSSGTVSRSFASGTVIGKTKAQVGGLAAHNDGIIIDSYTTANVQSDGDPRKGIMLGGMIGENHRGRVSTSYSLGMVQNIQAFGGLIGIDEASAGHIKSAYWDLDMSGVNDPAQGAYDPRNDPGITGLSDAQLKSGLPDGFDPKIWAQSPSINNGYPYLLANPPPKRGQ
jgi:hypothetical protein